MRIPWLAVTAAVVGCDSPAPPRDEVDAIRTTVASVAHHIDGKRWDDLRALYADEVETDYTSLFGGAPQKQPGDGLIGTWRGALEKVATHHLLGPIVVTVDGAAAFARCHVRAMHRTAGASSGETWEVFGHYRFELARKGAGWSITKMKLETLLQLGNAKLLAEAGTTPSK